MGGAVSAHVRGRPSVERSAAGRLVHRAEKQQQGFRVAGKVVVVLNREHRPEIIQKKLKSISATDCNPVGHS